MPLQPFERLRTGPPLPEVGDLLSKLAVDVAHPREERDHRHDELREPQRRDHLLQPLAQLTEVRRIR